MFELWTVLLLGLFGRSASSVDGDSVPVKVGETSTRNMRGVSGNASSEAAAAGYAGQHGTLELQAQQASGLSQPRHTANQSRWLHHRHEEAAGKNFTAARHHIEELHERFHGDSQELDKHQGHLGQAAANFSDDNTETVSSRAKPGKNGTDGARNHTWHHRHGYGHQGASNQLQSSTSTRILNQNSTSTHVRAAGNESAADRIRHRIESFNAEYNHTHSRRRHTDGGYNYSSKHHHHSEPHHHDDEEVEDSEDSDSKRTKSSSQRRRMEYSKDGELIQNSSASSSRRRRRRVDSFYKRLVGEKDSGSDGYSEEKEPKKPVWSWNGAEAPHNEAETQTTKGAQFRSLLGPLQMVEESLLQYHALVSAEALAVEEEWDSFEQSIAQLLSWVEHAPVLSEFEGSGS